MISYSIQGGPSLYIRRFSIKETLKLFKSIVVRSHNMVIIFWDFVMYDQIFLSPQVKLSVLVINKHGMYELPHELPNNLRLKIL